MKLIIGSYSKHNLIFIFCCKIKKHLGKFISQVEKHLVRSHFS